MKPCKKKIPVWAGTSVGRTYHYCNWPVVKDGYCNIHHPDAVRKRKEALDAKPD